MRDNFDLKSFLIENKMTRNSILLAENNVDPLPIEGDLVGDTFKIDFDVIGEYWWDVFKETYGHEYDENDDKDHRNFEIIQNRVNSDLINHLKDIYGRPIKLKFIY